MTKKFKVKTRAVFNRRPPGSIIELTEEQAHKYASIGYVEVIEEVSPVKKKSAGKKTTTASKSKTKTTEKTEKKDDK